MRVKDAVGRFGEQVATEHLSRHGLEILDRNWRCRDGELDIVARDGATLVFIEVKTRSGTGFGVPAAAVNASKIARLRRLAVHWMAAHRDADRFWDAVRFDVVSVLRGGSAQGASGAISGEVRIEHLRGAF